MSNTILRHEVLKEIDTGKPFNLVFLTADRRRGTGGEIKELHGWAQVQKATIPTTKQIGQVKKTNSEKDPIYTVHKLINVFNPSNERDHIISVHWRLMVFFNSKRIIQ